MLEKTTAFVTGASQGIGREIALTLAEYGANVTLAARSDGIHETHQQLDDPERGLAVKTDITDEESVRNAIERTVDAFGGLDCLVNNAGISLVSEGAGGPLETTDMADWWQVQETNVMGTAICSKYAIEPLSDGGGNIINIASTAGKGPYPNGSAYAASKAAIINLGRTLAYELGEDGIGVNTVCPGGVKADTSERFERVVEEHAKSSGISYEEREEQLLEQQAFKQFVHAHDVAELVAFLASENARMITAQDINISGGMAWY